MALSLLGYFGGSEKVSVNEGDDPPDIYLNFSDSCIGVEVTQLRPPTIEQGRPLGNRTTQDLFGIRLVNELNINVGPILPDGMSLHVHMDLPIKNPRKYKKILRDWVTEVAKSPALDYEERRDIQGSKTKISIIQKPAGRKKIVGFITSNNSSADIALNARLILEDRIRKKSAIFVRLENPVWLALLNDYFLADADIYTAAAREIKLNHCFERIFIVFDDNSVSELIVGR